MKPSLFATIALVIAVATSGCDEAPEQDRIVGTLERDRIELVAEAAEPITAIAVREGDRVAADAAVLHLDPSRQQARLQQARASAEEAAARLAELQRGPREERIVEARARLGGAEKQLAFRRSELARLQQLLDKGLATPEEVDRAAAQRDGALAERDAARARLTELERGATDEELAQARAALAAAQARVREFETTVARLTVRAPQAGRVDSLPFEVGEQPRVGDVVAVLLAGDGPYARVYVPEAVMARLAPGVALTVHVDGVEAALTGTLRRLSREPTFTPYYALTEYDRGRVSFLAEIDLPDGADELPAGIPLQVDVPEAP